MTPRTVVVAICGTRGSGKDSIAAILSREAGFVNFKFARPLKDAIRGLFSLGAEHVDGDLKDVVHPAWGVTPRALMQWFGTEVMQHELAKMVPSIGRRFWADRLVSSLESFVSGAGRAVVTDMRFRHELDALREAFGDQLIAIRVERRQSDADAHESETASASLDVDLVVANDGTLEQLGDLARGALCFGGRYVHRASKRGARLLSARDGMLVVEDEEDRARRSCSVAEWTENYCLSPQ